MKSKTFTQEKSFRNVANEEWAKLTKKQQEGIMKGIKQLEAGQWIPHKVVLRKYYKKYSGL